MIRRIGLATAIVAAVATYGYAITWDDSLEFDSADDFDAVSHIAYSEGDLAFTRSDSGGESTLVLSAPGYLAMKNLGNKESYSHQVAGFLSSPNGWTAEIRARLDRSVNYPGKTTNKKTTEFRFRNSVEDAILYIGSGAGTDVVGNDPAFPSGSIEQAQDSWTPDDPMAGRLVDPSSDWHVYRILYDPADVDQEVEVWVDGTRVTKGPGRPNTSTSYIKFGLQKDGFEAGVHVDYIRWAVGTVERPSGPGLVDPPLRNRSFDTMFDENGAATQPFAQSPAFWYFEPDTDVFPASWLYEETSDLFRHEHYGKALKVGVNEGYSSYFYQEVTADVGSQVTFLAWMNGYNSNLQLVQGRVGIDPDHGYLDRTSASIIWSNWATLADFASSTYGWQPVSTTVVTTSPTIGVFIQVEAPQDNFNIEQAAFVDDTSLTIVPPSCDNPPAITSITPNQGGAGSTLTGVAVVGSNFVAGQTTVRLRRAGQSDIVATTVNVLDGSNLLCDIDLTGAAQGAWSVVVGTTGCPNATLADGFVVGPPCNDPAQDTDADGDVDLADFAVFLACFNGPNRPWPGPPIDPGKCACMDQDLDQDVDLADFGTFLSCFNGPARPPAAGCP